MDIKWIFALGLMAAVAGFVACSHNEAPEPVAVEAPAEDQPGHNKRLPPCRPHSA